MKKKKVCIFIFDNVEILDFAGPYEVFSSARFSEKQYSDVSKVHSRFSIYTVSERRKKIITSGGLKVYSDYTFSNCPKPNILFIPGGKGTRTLINNKKVLNWIYLHKDIELLASICTGSLLLAKSNLLKNRNATTHWGAYNLLKQLCPEVKIVKDQRFVYDKYFTSSGVSAGIDMSLAILELKYGKVIAKNTAKYMDYIYY